MKKTIVQGHALQYVTTRKDSVIIPKETFDLCHGRSAKNRPHDTIRRRAHPGQRPWRAFVSLPCGRTPARQCFALCEVKQLDVELEAKKKAKEKTDKENANIIPDKAAIFSGKASWRR